MERWLSNVGGEGGATATEYLVMLILAALIILGMVRVFGDTVKEKYKNANSELSGTLAAEKQSGGGSGSAGGAGGGSGGKAGVDGKGAAGGSGGGQGGSGGNVAGASAGGGAAGSGGGASGSGGGSGGSGGGGAAGVQGGGMNSNPAIEGPDGDKKGGADMPEKRSFNPIVLLAAIGLVGLLIYVVASGKKG